jgi:hypothetical protein
MVPLSAATLFPRRASGCAESVCFLLGCFLLC